MSRPVAIRSAIQALNSSHDISLRLSIITAPPSGNGTHGVAEFQPRLVELRFAVTDGTVEHGGDFIMLVSLDIVQHEDEPVACRQVGDGAFQRQAVYGTGQGQIRGPETAARSFFRRWLHG